MSKIPRNANGSKPSAPIDPKKRPFAVRSVVGVTGSKSVSPKTSPNANAMKDNKISKPSIPAPTSRSAGDFFDLGSKSDEFSSPSFPSFQHGDIIWAQTDPKFPYWPGLVFFEELLADEIRSSVHLPSINRNSPRRQAQKLSVFFYGRNDYDLVVESSIVVFDTSYEDFFKQAIHPAYHAVFHKSIEIAFLELQKPVEERMLVIRSPSDTSGESTPQTANIAYVANSTVEEVGYPSEDMQLSEPRTTEETPLETEENNREFEKDVNEPPYEENDLDTAFVGGSSAFEEVVTEEQSENLPTSVQNYANSSCEANDTIVDLQDHTICAEAYESHVEHTFDNVLPVSEEIPEVQYVALDSSHSQSGNDVSQLEIFIHESSSKGNLLNTADSFFSTASTHYSDPKKINSVSDLFSMGSGSSSHNTSIENIPIPVEDATVRISLLPGDILSTEQTNMYDENSNEIHHAITEERPMFNVLVQDYKSSVDPFDFPPPPNNSVDDASSHFQARVPIAGTTSTDSELFVAPASIGSLDAFSSSINDTATSPVKSKSSPIKAKVVAVDLFGTPPTSSSLDPFSITSVAPLPFDFHNTTKLSPPTQSDFMFANTSTSLKEVDADVDEVSSVAAVEVYSNANENGEATITNNTYTSSDSVFPEVPTNLDNFPPPPTVNIVNRPGVADLFATAPTPFDTSPKAHTNVDNIPPPPTVNIINRPGVADLFATAPTPFDASPKVEKVASAADLFSGSTPATIFPPVPAAPSAHVASKATIRTKPAAAADLFGAPSSNASPFSVDTSKTVNDSNNLFASAPANTKNVSLPTSIGVKSTAADLFDSSSGSSSFDDAKKPNLFAPTPAQVERVPQKLPLAEDVFVARPPQNIPSTIAPPPVAKSAKSTDAMDIFSSKSASIDKGSVSNDPFSFTPTACVEATTAQINLFDSHAPTIPHSTKTTNSAAALFGGTPSSATNNTIKPKNVAAVDIFGGPQTKTDSFPDTPVSLTSLEPPAVTRVAPTSSAAANDLFGSSQPSSTIGNISIGYENKAAPRPAGVFKGRAQVVAGVSPFDASGGSNDLFPASKAAANPFDMFGSSPKPSASADLFGAPPGGHAAPPSRAPTSQNARPHFGDASPIAFHKAAVVSVSTTATDLFNSNPPAHVHPRPTAVKKDATAFDIFSTTPPPAINAPAPMTDFSVPPTAPGVKAPPRPANQSNVFDLPPNPNSPATPSTDSPASTPTATTSKTPVSNPVNKSNKNHLNRLKMQNVPASTNGLAVIPSATPTVPAANNFDPFASGPPPSIRSAANPIVNPNKLASLVSIQPESPLPEVTVSESIPSTDYKITLPPSVPGISTSLNSITDASTLRPRGRYIKPSSTIVSFGFGGKLIVMQPDLNTCPPVYHSTSNNRILAIGIRPTPLKVHRCVDIICNKSVTQYPVQGIPEMIQFKKLVQSTSIDSNAESFNDLINHQISQGGNMMLISEEYFRSKVSTSSLTPQALYEKRIQAADSEKLLWMSLKVALKHQGQMNSGIGASEPDTPERAIINLLSDAMNQTNIPTESDGTKFSVNNMLHGKIYQKNEIFLQQKSSPPSNNTEKLSRVQYLTQIEIFLLAGQRDAAYELAIQQEDWSLAMMFACVLGPEKYQETMKVYAQKNFAPTSPLHLVSMLYSNQAQKTISFHGSSTGKFLHNPQQFQNPSNIGVPSSNAESSNVLTEWKMVVSILLSNKTHDWDQLMNTLALRLQNEAKDIFAAHFVYLCGNNNLSFPKKKAPKSTDKSTNNADNKEDEATKDFTLLGCESSFGGSRIMADVISISALRMSEIFERSLSLTPISSPQEEKTSASGKSGISGMFGWFQSNNKNQGSAPPGPNEGPKVVDEKLLKLAVVLCPYKLRFAMILADMGLVKEASSYIRSALQLVQEVGIAGAEDNNGTKKKSVPPFNKKFVLALEEFADRLGVRPLHAFDGSVSVGTNFGAPPVGVPSNNNATTNAQNKSAGSSFWDISKVISSSTLKEFVDGPQVTAQQPPVTLPTAPVPIINVQAQSSAQGPPAISGFPPMASNVKNAAVESAPAINAPPSIKSTQSSNAHAKQKYPSHAYQQVGGGPPLPFVSSSRNNNNNSAPPASQNASPFPPMPPSAANNNAPFPSVPYPVGPPTGADMNDPFGDSAVGGNSPGWYVGGGNNTSAPPSDSGGLSAFSDNAGAADDFGLAPPSSMQVMQGNMPSVQAPPSAYPYNAPSPYTHTQQPPQPSYQQPYQPSNHLQPAHPPAPYPQSAPYQQPVMTTKHEQPPMPFPTPVAPTPVPAPNSGKSNDKVPAAVDKTDKKEKDSKAPTATNNNNNNADPGGGLMGTFRKNMFKWIYPDAHDANENIGKSLEAYYDEKLGRWVFPGEENEATNNPALKPPPTIPSGPMGGFSMSAAPPGGGPSGAMLPPTGANTTGPAAADNDPLAALMAPPPMRAIPPAAPGNDDPLASMMAPPSSSRYSAYGVRPGGAPPSSSAGAPPVKFNVWKPPVATFNPGAAAVAPVASFEASNDHTAPISGGGGAPVMMMMPPMGPFDANQNQQSSEGLSDIPLN